jgi:hypothetical protein
MGSDKLPELETGWLLCAVRSAEEFGFAVMARNEEDVVGADHPVRSLSGRLMRPASWNGFRTPAIQWQNVSSSAVRRANGGRLISTV